MFKVDSYSRLLSLANVIFYLVFVLNFLKS